MRIRQLGRRLCAGTSLCAHGLGGVVRALGVALVLAFIPQNAVCQSAETARPDSLRSRPVYFLPEVTVVATRGRVEVLDAPAHVIVVEPRDPAESLASVLGSTGLVHIRSYGSTGLSNASVRGGGSSQLAVVLDGFALTNAQLGQFDLSLVPSSLVRTVEFMPGGASALYGSSAMSGAVRISSRDTGEEKLTMLATRGAFGERAVEASGRASLGMFGFAAGVRDMRTDGDYSFSNAALFPARRTRRENADRRDRSGHLSVGVSRGATEVSGAFLALAAERGLPGVAGGRNTGERQADRLLRATVHAEQVRSKTVVEVGLLGERSRLDYENPMLGLDESGVINRFGLRASTEHSISSHSSARVSGDVDVNSASHPSLPADARHASYSLSATAVASMAGFRVFPAARLDRYAIPGRSPSLVFSPRLGVSRRLSPDGPVSVKWSVGRAFRMPTLNDLFWVGGGARGSRDLQPERSVSTEAGIAWLRRRGGEAATRAEVSAFLRRSINTISWLPDELGIWSPRNLGDVTAMGIQSSALARIRVAVFEITGTAGYTFVHARERTVDGARAYIRYAPAHEAHVAVRSVHDNGLFLSADLHAAGRRYVATDGSDSLPAYLAAEISFGFRAVLGRTVQTIRIDLRNVGNHQYAVVQGYPVPPRHLRLHASITIR